MHSRIRLQLTVDNGFIRVNSKTEEKTFTYLEEKRGKRRKNAFIFKVSMKTEENIISTLKQFLITDHR